MNGETGLVSVSRNWRIKHSKSEASELAKKAKELAANPPNHSFLSGTYMLEGENGPKQVVL